MAGDPGPRANASRPLTSVWLVAVLAIAAPDHSPVQPPPDLARGCSARSSLERLSRYSGPSGVRAALLLGWCRTQEGRIKDAMVLLDRAASHPTLSAHALVWAGEAALASGDVEGAGWRAARALAQSRSSWVKGKARMVLARVSLEAKEAQVAERHAREVLERAQSDQQRAAAWELLGRASELAGRRAEAVHRYARAWWGFPGTAASRAAEVRLRALLGYLPPPPVKARLERARRLRDPQQALREWKEALRQGLSGPQAGEAWLRVGVLQLGTAEAVTSLRRAAGFPGYAAEARYWLGVALARRGEAAALSVWQDLVARHPKNPWAARALWALATHAQRAGQLQAADRWLGVLVSRFPTSPLAARARWQRGWLRYLAGRYSEAEVLWRQAAAAGPTGPYTSAALYWAAQSRLRRGLDGQQLLQQAARWPLSYYGRRARERLGVPAPPTPSDQPPWKLPQDRFGRAEVELAALGFFREAAEEAGEVLRRGPSRFARRLLAWARARAGDLPGSVAAAEALAVSWSPSPGSHESDLWKLAYPLAYFPVVHRWASSHGVDPLLVLAVMREESRFRPDAVSSAGAVGLMQVLPATARDVDPEIGASRLTHPETNVRLGTAYLARQLREFRGDVVMALVAYNAGPGAARRFRDQPTTDIDEFVEGIPYAETRDYVKRVLESYGIYRWLYGGR